MAESILVYFEIPSANTINAEFLILPKANF